MIKYKKIERNNGISQNGSMVVPVLGEAVDAREMARMIEETVGIPAIRTMSVLAAFSEALVRCIEEGRPVCVDGIGTVRPALTIEDGEIVVKKLTVSGSPVMKNLLRKIELQEVTE